MDIITRISRELVAGKVICSYSFPEGFDILSDPEGIRDVEGILESLGLRIAITSSKKAFFAAEESTGEAERHIRGSIHCLLNEARRISDVAEFLMNVYPDGQRLHLGQVIETSNVLEVVNGSNALEDMLANLTAGFNMTSNTTSKRISNLFRKLADDGFLKVMNQSREVYQVTGRTERAWDIIENILQMVPEAAEKLEKIAEESRQGDLFHA
ncbi:hypothetical protein ACEUZ9_001109 [Paracoccus litorisediminis]|uniref:condensin complex protein MksE n=1 Tax=Paracoccus litorisediminis TaxID=2006130 RepID=UPI003731F49B